MRVLDWTDVIDVELDEAVAVAGHATLLARLERLQLVEPAGFTVEPPAHLSDPLNDRMRQDA